MVDAVALIWRWWILLEAVDKHGNILVADWDNQRLLFLVLDHYWPGLMSCACLSMEVSVIRTVCGMTSHVVVCMLVKRKDELLLSITWRTSLHSLHVKVPSINRGCGHSILMCDVSKLVLNLVDLWLIPYCNYRHCCNVLFCKCAPSLLSCCLRNLKQELSRRWDSERELSRSAPGSYPNSLK